MNFFLSYIKCLYQYDKTIMYTIEGAGFQFPSSKPISLDNRLALEELSRVLF